MVARWKTDRFELQNRGSWKIEERAQDQQLAEGGRQRRARLRRLKQQRVPAHYPTTQRQTEP